MNTVVIEDKHAQHAHFLRKHFEQIGLQVIVCTSHSEVLLILKKETVDRLVIDLDEGNSDQLLELRKTYGGPIIGWSALPSTRSDFRVRAHCTAVYDIAQLLHTTAKDFHYSLTKIEKNATVIN